MAGKSRQAYFLIRVDALGLRHRVLTLRIGGPPLDLTGRRARFIARGLGGHFLQRRAEDTSIRNFRCPYFHKE